MAIRALVHGPLPEEFSLGHAGRIHRVNALTSPFSALTPFLRTIGRSNSEATSPSAIHALAQLTGMSMVEYGCNHTLLPFYSFAFVDEESATPENWPLKIVRTRGLCMSGRPAKWCMRCAQTDISQFGFSYWRRPHQIPGVVFCPTHQTALFSEPGEDAFLCFPHEWLHIKPPEQENLALTPTLAEQRYTAIALEMMAGPQAPPQSIWRRLGGESFEFALVCCLHTRAKRLDMATRFVQQLVSEAWLHDVLPYQSIATDRRRSDSNTVVIYGAASLAATLAFALSSSADAKHFLRTFADQRRTSVNAR